MDLHMSTIPMSNVFRVLSLSIIFDIHDGVTIVTISMVDDMLDSSIRKVDLVLSLDITSLISRPYFTKVRVILVIMNSILEVERIWSLIIMISTMSSTCSTNSTNTSSRTSNGESRDSKETRNMYKSNHCLATKS